MKGHDARRWIRVAACLLVVASGLASLVACGRTPVEIEASPGATETQQARDAQPTASRPTPQETVPSPESVSTPEDGEPQVRETSAPSPDAPAGSFAPGSLRDRDYWPTERWRTSSPEEQGMDSARLLAACQQHLDSLVCHAADWVPVRKSRACVRRRSPTEAGLGSVRRPSPNNLHGL